MKEYVKTGLFGIGLDIYLPQFEGLKSRLETYMKKAEKKSAHQIQIVMPVWCTILIRHLQPLCKVVIEYFVSYFVSCE